MEDIQRYPSLEQARNAAIRWLECRDIEFGPHREIAIGRLGEFAGKEVGVRATQSPFWRLRLDYDDKKGAHFNTEFNSGPQREKAAFLFPATPKLIDRLVRQREPR